MMSPSPHPARREPPRPTPARSRSPRSPRAPATGSACARARRGAGRGRIDRDGAGAGGTCRRRCAGRKVLYWHDPMVPGKKFDKPGKSPFMDMQLVPVYADSGGDTGEVAISPRLVQSFGIRTAVAKEGTLETGFSAVGVVGVDERLIVAVQARSPGYVEKLRVRAQYDTVLAGSRWSSFTCPTGSRRKRNCWRSRRARSPAPRNSWTPRARACACSACPTPKSRAWSATRRPSARVTVTAPASGIVWEIGARDGMAVMPGTTLFKLAGLTSSG